MSNLKRHTIELVKEVKEGEVITETYVTPVFIPFSEVYEATDVMEDVMKNEKKKSEKEVIDLMIDFVVRIYGNQFSKEDVVKGLHGPGGNGILFDQVLFVAQGKENSETKKFLAKKR